VLTAWSAMLQDEFLLHGATSSTGGCAIFIVINGDVRKQMNCTGEFNALGGSDRASTAIGRAIRLGLINILDVRPGGVDRSTFGHPGKFSFCVAEDEEGAQWTPLAQQRGMPDGVSAVTVMAAGSPRQIMNEWTTEPREILETYAAEMRANMRQYSIWAGNYAIVIAPQHREHLLRAGWTKANIADYIYERARIHRREWAEVGKASVVRDRRTHVTGRFTGNISRRACRWFWCGYTTMAG